MMIILRIFLTALAVNAICFATKDEQQSRSLVWHNNAQVITSRLVVASAPNKPIILANQQQPLSPYHRIELLDSAHTIIGQLSCTLQGQVILLLDTGYTLELPGDLSHLLVNPETYTGMQIIAPASTVLVRGIYTQPVHCRAQTIKIIDTVAGPDSSWLLEAVHLEYAASFEVQNLEYAVTKRCTIDENSIVRIHGNALGTTTIERFESRGCFNVLGQSLYSAQSVLWGPRAIEFVGGLHGVVADNYQAQHRLVSHTLSIIKAKTLQLRGAMHIDGNYVYLGAQHTATIDTNVHCALHSALQLTGNKTVNNGTVIIQSHNISTNPWVNENSVAPQQVVTQLHHPVLMPQIRQLMKGSGVKIWGREKLTNTGQILCFGKQIAVGTDGTMMLGGSLDAGLLDSVCVAAQAKDATIQGIIDVTNGQTQLFMHNFLTITGQLNADLHHIVAPICSISGTMHAQQAHIASRQLSVSGFASMQQLLQVKGENVTVEPTGRVNAPLLALTKKFDNQGAIELNDSSAITTDNFSNTGTINAATSLHIEVAQEPEVGALCGDGVVGITAPQVPDYKKMITEHRMKGGIQLNVQDDIVLDTALNTSAPLGIRASNIIVQGPQNFGDTTVLHAAEKLDASQATIKATDLTLNGTNELRLQNSTITAAGILQESTEGTLHMDDAQVQAGGYLMHAGNLEAPRAEVTTGFTRGLIEGNANLSGSIWEATARLAEGRPQLNDRGMQLHANNIVARSEKIEQVKQPNSPVLPIQERGWRGLILRAEQIVANLFKKQEGNHCHTKEVITHRFQALSDDVLQLTSDGKFYAQAPKFTAGQTPAGERYAAIVGSVHDDTTIEPVKLFDIRRWSTYECVGHRGWGPWREDDYRWVPHQSTGETTVRPEFNVAGNALTKAGPEHTLSIPAVRATIDGDWHLSARNIELPAITEKFSEHSQRNYQNSSCCGMCTTHRSEIIDRTWQEPVGPEVLVGKDMILDGERFSTQALRCVVCGKIRDYTNESIFDALPLQSHSEHHIARSHAIRGSTAAGTIVDTTTHVPTQMVAHGIEFGNPANPGGTTTLTGAQIYNQGDTEVYKNIVEQPYVNTVHAETYAQSTSNRAFQPPAVPFVTGHTINGPTDLHAVAQTAQAAHSLAHDTNRVIGAVSNPQQGLCNELSSTATIGQTKSWARTAMNASSEIGGDYSWGDMQVHDKSLHITGHNEARSLAGTIDTLSGSGMTHRQQAESVSGSTSISVNPLQCSVNISSQHATSNTSSIEHQPAIFQADIVDATCRTLDLDEAQIRGRDIKLHVTGDADVHTRLNSAQHTANQDSTSISLQWKDDVASSVVSSALASGTSSSKQCNSRKWAAAPAGIIAENSLNLQVDGTLRDTNGQFTAPVCTVQANQREHLALQESEHQINEHNAPALAWDAVRAGIACANEITELGNHLAALSEPPIESQVTYDPESRVALEQRLQNATQSKAQNSQNNDHEHSSPVAASTNGDSNVGPAPTPSQPRSQLPSLAESLINIDDAQHSFATFQTQQGPTSSAQNMPLMVPTHTQQFYRNVLDVDPYDHNTPESNMPAIKAGCHLVQEVGKAVYHAPYKQAGQNLVNNLAQVAGAMAQQVQKNPFAMVGTMGLRVPSIARCFQANTQVGKVMMQAANRNQRLLVAANQNRLPFIPIGGGNAVQRFQVAPNRAAMPQAINRISTIGSTAAQTQLQTFKSASLAHWLPVGVTASVIPPTPLVQASLPDAQQPTPSKNAYIRVDPNNPLYRDWANQYGIVDFNGLQIPAPTTFQPEATVANSSDKSGSQSRIGKVDLEYYRESGSDAMPVQRFIAKEFKHNKQAQEAIKRVIQKLEQRWPNVQESLIKKIIGFKGLYELREVATKTRIIFSIEQNKLVLLHAFIKRTDEVPRYELEVANERAKKYSAQQAKETANAINSSSSRDGSFSANDGDGSQTTAQELLEYLRRVDIGFVRQQPHGIMPFIIDRNSTSIESVPTQELAAIPGCNIQEIPHNQLEELPCIDMQEIDQPSSISPQPAMDNPWKHTYLEELQPYIDELQREGWQEVSLDDLQELLTPDIQVLPSNGMAMHPLSELKLTVLSEDPLNKNKVYLVTHTDGVQEILKVVVCKNGKMTERVFRDRAIDLLISHVAQMVNAPIAEGHAITTEQLPQNIENREHVALASVHTFIPGEYLDHNFYSMSDESDFAQLLKIPNLAAYLAFNDIVGNEDLRHENYLIHNEHITGFDMGNALLSDHLIEDRVGSLVKAIHRFPALSLELRNFLSKYIEELARYVDVIESMEICNVVEDIVQQFQIKISAQWVANLQRDLEIQLKNSAYSVHLYQQLYSSLSIPHDKEQKICNKGSGTPPGGSDEPPMRSETSGSISRLLIATSLSTIALTRSIDDCDQDGRLSKVALLSEGAFSKAYLVTNYDGSQFVIKEQDFGVNQMIQTSMGGYFAQLLQAPAPHAQLTPTSILPKNIQDTLKQPFVVHTDFVQGSLLAASPHNHFISFHVLARVASFTKKFPNLPRLKAFADLLNIYDLNSSNLIVNEDQRKITLIDLGDSCNPTEVPLLAGNTINSWIEQLEMLAILQSPQLKASQQFFRAYIIELERMFIKMTHSIDKIDAEFQSICSHAMNAARERGQQQQIANDIEYVERAWTHYIDNVQKYLPEALTRAKQYIAAW